MTNKELSRWVREKTTREWKYNHVNYIYSFYIYTEGCADEEVCDRIVIREDDGGVARTTCGGGRMTDEEKNEIKYRLSDIGAKVGELALEYIAELEEENAELKEQCLILADCNTCNSTCKTENIKMKKQLTKAKELIGELISSLSVVGECEEECELLNRAEQFLREVGDDSKRFEKGY